MSADDLICNQIQPSAFLELFTSSNSRAASGGS